jgi:hypothetical protein
MSAITNPLLTPPDNFSSQVSSATVSPTAITFTVEDATGLPTEGVGVLFKKDSDGKIVSGSIEFIHWTGVSSNTITLTDVADRGLTGSDSGAQTYVAGDFFEVWVSSYYYDSQRASFLNEHQVGGEHDISAMITNGSVLDEDDMASDSDTAVPTQQSVKAYVDNNATSTDGWTEYSDVVPTRTTADDPTYVITFSGVDLTDRISVGMKVKWTQNSTVRYGIVTAIAFSTNTTLTLYGGTDYDVDDTATHVISAFNYSPHKAPFGFPMSPDKWTILLTTTTGTQTPPTQNTWHNLGGSGELHIGDWYVRFWAGAYTDTGTAGVKVTQITVSTANNSASDATYTIAQTDYDVKSHTSMASWVRNFTVASKTTYFVNARTTQASQSNLGLTRNRLEAVCAYL